MIILKSHKMYHFPVGLLASLLEVSNNNNTSSSASTQASATAAATTTSTASTQASAHEQIFNVMGSWKEKHYQEALEVVETEMISNTSVPVQVDFQPDNPKDINAIKAKAYVNEKWRIIGNIQKHKILKLTVALRQKTIIHCGFT